MIGYLRERELVTHVYKEKWVSVRLAENVKVEALTYVVDRDHVQYAKPMAAEELVKIIGAAEGKSGRNRDYVTNTVTSLKALGIRDHALERIVRQL